MESNRSQGESSSPNLLPIFSELTDCLEQVSLLLRSTLDLSDRLASNATSDPTIEAMLEELPDPFDSYRLETDETRDVFTVLPPMNLGIASAKKVVESDRETVRSGHEAGKRMAYPGDVTRLPLNLAFLGCPIVEARQGMFGV